MPREVQLTVPAHTEFVTCDYTIEEVWGWAKTVGGLRRSRFRGIPKLQWAAYLVGAAYNLVRIASRLAPSRRQMAAA
jgi:hypothetical protein